MAAWYCDEWPQRGVYSITACDGMFQSYDGGFVVLTGFRNALFDMMHDDVVDFYAIGDIESYIDAAFGPQALVSWFDDDVDKMMANFEIAMDDWHYASKECLNMDCKKSYYESVKKNASSEDPCPECGSTYTWVKDWWVDDNGSVYEVNFCGRCGNAWKGELTIMEGHKTANNARVLKSAYMKMAGVAQDLADDIVSVLDDYDLEDLKDDPYGIVFEYLDSYFIYSSDIWDAAQEYVTDQELCSLFWEELEDDIWNSIGTRIDDYVADKEAADRMAHRIASASVRRMKAACRRTERTRNAKRSVRGAKRKRATMKKESGWYGHPNIEMEYYNDWADPSLVYDGYRFNYYDIEGAMWEMFREDMEHEHGIPYEEIIENGDFTPEYERIFEEYVRDNAEWYLNDLIGNGYFDEGVKDWRHYAGTKPARKASSKHIAKRMPRASRYAAMRRGMH